VELPVISADLSKEYVRMRSADLGATQSGVTLYRGRAPSSWCRAAGIRHPSHRKWLAASAICRPTCLWLRVFCVPLQICGQNIPTYPMLPRSIPSD